MAASRLKLRIKLRRALWPVRQRLRAWSIRPLCPLDLGFLEQLPELGLVVLERMVAEPAPWQAGEVSYRALLEHRRLFPTQLFPAKPFPRRWVDELWQSFYKAGLIEKHYLPKQSSLEPTCTPTAQTEMLVAAERQRRALDAVKAKPPGPRQRTSALA